MTGLTNEQVVLTPVVSEKSYAGIAERRYTFQVHPDAHKTQIRQAMSGVLCRCGANARMLKAITRYARGGKA